MYEPVHLAGRTDPGVIAGRCRITPSRSSGPPVHPVTAAGRRSERDHFAIPHVLRYLRNCHDLTSS
ncbi:hypothetical protein [Microbispora bryophytorum]|uniref:hypothetical protein n=1 Tax=Microbispora bryophytorum TaxID=1460882 RepID=UPI0033E1054C